MRCPSCGARNPPNKRFCGKCGSGLRILLTEEPAPQTTKCPSCGADNPQDKVFCGDCGGPMHRSPEQLVVDLPTGAVSSPPVHPGGIRTGYLVVGGFMAASFLGLFYWAVNFTYTEEVWHEIAYGYGYWETVTRTIDPAIPALMLAMAIVGAIMAVYGVVSRK